MTRNVAAVVVVVAAAASWQRKCWDSHLVEARPNWRLVSDKHLKTADETTDVVWWVLLQLFDAEQHGHSKTWALSENSGAAERLEARKMVASKRKMTTVMAQRYCCCCCCSP